MQRNHMSILGISCAVLTFVGIAVSAWADSPATGTATAITSAPKQPELLAWDAPMKELSTTNGQATANFFFAVTNVSESLVVIDRVMTSCGCTVAKLPSQPWLLPPHSDGKIDVSVNLAGKSGTIFKTVTVVSTNAPKTLTVKVNIPENPEMARSRNQQMAMADRQAVFRNDCARCHAEPAKDKTGKELYAAACAICHDSPNRAVAVPNLHALNHSTDYNYWKVWASMGKAGSMMPAFAMNQGGPLTDDQINSLAKYLSESIPANPAPKTHVRLAIPAPESVPPIPTK